MATLSKKVLLAPDSIISFIDRAHDKHDQAAAFFRFFAQNQYQLYMDTLTLNRVYEYLFKNISPSLAKDFIRTISLSEINMLYTDENDFKAALKTLLIYPNTDLSFPLAMLATLANRRNIPQVCTFVYFPNLFALQTFFLPI